MSMGSNKPAKLFIATGWLAILAGGALSAFMAKQPSTLAMWASAYVVLVVGVSQVFFGISLEKFALKESEVWQWWVFGLFNIGSVLVVASSVVKYSGGANHMMITAIGGVVLVAALLLLGWSIRAVVPSLQKFSMFAVISLLGLCVPLGLVLASQKYSVMAISNYEQCKDAGGAIMESHPEQCLYEGKTYTNHKQSAEDNSFIGSTEGAAMAKAKNENIPARVVERDGEQLPITMDFVHGRYNLYVKNGKVYQVEIEGQAEDMPEYNSN